MPFSLSYFCGVAAAMFVAVGLSMAAVRWFHMCRPYDRNPRYYYPGRPYVIVVFLSSLALLPYIINPESPDAWFLARLFFLPFTLFQFTVLEFSYFGGVMEWRKWRAPMLLIGLPLVVCILAADVLALVPGDQIGGISLWLMYALGILITGICVTALLLVLSWAKSFDEDEFSNPADFPVIFARRSMVMVVVNMALCWLGALVGSPVLLAVIMLLLAASQVLFIIAVLHPHRRRPLEEEPEDKPEAEPVRKAPSAQILSAIHTVVEEREAFLDAHLTIQDVADRCGYSRSYIAGLFKSEFGGFFPYVNRLRLQHVEAYQKAHPSATLQEAVLESGFNSRQAYYAVKAKFEE